MTAYDAIRRATGFDVPPLYRRMAADAVIRYGSSPKEWKQTWKQRALERPPALMLAFTQVEWWEPEEIANFSAPDYWRRDVLLVPFAANAAGDLWCWHPAERSTEDPEQCEIVLVADGESEATVFAPTLEAFLLRHLIQAFAEIVEDDGTDFTREQRAQAVRANVRTVAPYLCAEWVELLEELAARPLVENQEWNCLGLLSHEEAVELVQVELDCPRLGVTFAHMD